jgi:hypothetical protein
VSLSLRGTSSNEIIISTIEYEQTGETSKKPSVLAS